MNTSSKKSSKSLKNLQNKKQKLINEMKKLNKEINNTAATKLQSTYRGKKNRNTIKKKQTAATKLQSTFRGKKNRNTIKKKQTAATKIQSTYRLLSKIKKVGTPMNLTKMNKNALNHVLKQSGLTTKNLKTMAFTSKQMKNLTLDGRVYNWQSSMIKNAIKNNSIANKINLNSIQRQAIIELFCNKRAKCSIVLKSI